MTRAQANTNLMRAIERSHESMMDVAHKLNWRIPLPPDYLSQLKADWQAREHERSGATPAHVIDACRRHVTDLAQRHKIIVREVCECIASGRGNIKTRVVETPPIRSPYSYVIACHQIFHVINGRPSTHRRTRNEEGGVVCVQCELESWQAVRRYAVVPWTPMLQENMRSSLASYRRYARAAEIAAIDSLIGNATTEPSNSHHGANLPTGNTAPQARGMTLHERQRLYTEKRLKLAV